MADGESPGFLKSVVSAFTLVTAWVFVTGWTYLHTFFGSFGVNVDSLDFPVYHFFLFFYTQFFAFSWSGFLFGVLLVGLFLVTWAGTQTTRPGWAIAVSCAYLFIFWAGFQLAVRNGKNGALQSMALDSQLPKIMLQFNEKKTPEYAAIEDTLASSDLRLLIESKDFLFVFKPVDIADPSIKVNVLKLDPKQISVSLRSTKVR